MPYTRRSALVVALLFLGGIVASLAGAAGHAAAGSGHFIRLPVIVNDDLFALQPGSPTYLSNFINSAGCNWSGIAGRAFGRDDNPVIGLTVHLEGGGINTDVLTGSGPAALGPGGYQIPVGDHPIETTGVYFIQLRNNMGAALSAAFMIPTYAVCAKNLVMVNFISMFALIRAQPFVLKPSIFPLTRNSQLAP